MAVGTRALKSSLGLTQLIPHVSYKIFLGLVQVFH